MENEVAEVPTDQTADDSYESFRASELSRHQQAVEPKTEEVSAPTEEEGKTEPDSEPGKIETQENDDEPKWTPKQQRRLDQLTREKYELRGLNKAQESELTRLRAKLAETPQGKTEAAADATKTKVADGKPQLTDFANHEDWVEALADWKADQKITARLAERDQQSQEATAKAKFEEFATEYTKGFHEFTKTHPDHPTKAALVAEKMADRPVLDAVLSETPESHALIHHLGGNDAELTRILGLPDHLAVMELGKIAASFAPKPPEKKPPQRTSSPPPPGKVAGGSAHTDPSDTDDYEDFRRQEDAKRKRR